MGLLGRVPLAMQPVHALYVRYDLRSGHSVADDRCSLSAMVDRRTPELPNFPPRLQLFGGHQRQGRLVHGFGINLLIGDGRSDQCFAEEADFVFAKDSLADHCAENALPHMAFANFADASKNLEALLDIPFEIPGMVHPCKGIRG